MEPEKKEKTLIEPVTYLNEDKKLIEPVTFLEQTKNVEEKKYLVVYYYQEDEKEFRSFEFITGRTKTYEFLKGFIMDAEFIDIYESKVLTDGVPIEQSASILEFMKLMEVYFNDGFDIRNYYDIEEGDDLNGKV